ncbi:BlaI/MecI/CopY family transcriptional regulator [Gemmatimonas phototrophica]|uniref:BlaI/MecI/CopY family transcriptional regulator n=1 Tax=Gemmatimonas phototrophica TaxID=1379270 RepID=UPI0006A6A7AB|nr:BlaI/MecI/CopY family transcriptional regulator [Gemmatimonas phototrophica]
MSARKAPLPKMGDAVRLSAEGVAKVLGDLEARLLTVVWQLDMPATARTVHEMIIDEHEVALLTVVTVLNKLVEKRILTRRKIGGLLHYAAAISAADFHDVASRRMVEGVIDFAPERLAACFVDVLAERDPAQLDHLAALVEEARRRRG